jgi:hypothetical protein
LESVTINKKFFKGKYYEIKDSIHNPFKLDINYPAVKSVEYLERPICRYGCFTLGIPKICAIKNELGNQVEEEIVKCTSVKMLMGLDEIKNLLQLGEDENLDLAATFCDIYATKFTVCIW